MKKLHKLVLTAAVLGVVATAAPRKAHADTSSTLIGIADFAIVKYIDLASPKAEPAPPPPPPPPPAK
jgi:hypothetical protein